MRGLAAILRREVFERRLIGLLALALGLIAVLLPLMPGFRPGGVAVTDLQGGMALGFALLLTLILALFLGGSIIAGDLAERRLGFYFSRPLPGWAIWGGKMAAALALIFGGALLVLAPAVLLGGNLNLDGIWGIGGVMSVSGASLLTTWALALLLVLLAAHAASVIVRARSSWAFLDLAALGVVAGLVGGVLRRLRIEGVSLQAGLPLRDQLGIVAWMELGLLAALLLSLALAGALQVVRGRTDLRRAHQSLSQSLWGMLLAAVLLFAGVTAWVLAAGPGDLLGVSGILAAPRAQTGHWIALDGPAVRRPGYNPSFFYDLDSGRALHARFGLISQFQLFGRTDMPVGFSADGRRAVWLEYDGPAFKSPVTAFRMDLDRPGSRPVRTTISLRYPPRSFALSPDGRRIATYEWEGRLTVSSVDDGRLLAAAQYESESTFPRLVFAGPDLLRMYEIHLPDFSPHQMLSSPAAIFEMDLTASTPQPRKTGDLPAMTGGIRDWSLSPAGDRILLRSADALGLCDGRTGMPLARLASGRARGTFLADGRVAVAETLPGLGPELRIFPADGRSEPRHLPFPGARSLIVADQPAPGLLWVVTSRPGAPGSVRDLWRVDLERGTVQPMGTRRLAELKLPQLARSPVDLEGKDGVIWFEPWAARERVALKGPAAPAAATPR
ncbi:MAG: hypothetical protein ACJ76Y_07610 [Thermoanaerobaculia bacterium]